MASLMLSAVVVAATASEPSPARFVIAGYAPDYRLESLDLSALAHNLTDVLLFSIAPTPQGTIDPGGITQIHHMRAARAKKAAPHLRALVSMGGGGRSAAFPQAVGSRQRREALAKALVKYCKRGKLDGAELRRLLFPVHDDSDVVAKEVTHLLVVADEDRDGKLSLLEAQAQASRLVRFLHQRAERVQDEL